jgi:acetyl esterase/lipase
MVQAFRSARSARTVRYTAAAYEYWQINRLSVRAGARTLARRIRRQTRLTGWSIPYEGVVEMMTLGTPSGIIQDAQQVRGPLDRVTRLSRALPATRQPETVGTWRGEWISTSRSNADRVILFLHGGGYISGSPATHRSVIINLAQAAEARVFALDYRLAPEYPFPAALEDAWGAYWWLLCQGIAPGQIVVAGDSAGGGLTVALMLALRAAGMPLPAGGACLSPWFDLALTGDSLTTNQATDYLNYAVLNASAQMYLGDHDRREPLASPLYADLQGLPPLLIQVGTAEMLLDDSRRFAQRARAAGVDVDLEIWPHMVHVWHFTYLIEPHARAAVRDIGKFVQQRTSRAPLPDAEPISEEPWPPPTAAPSSRLIRSLSRLKQRRLYPRIRQHLSRRASATNP